MGFARKRAPGPELSDRRPRRYVGRVVARAWRSVLALVLTVVGALLLGLAVLDWVAYDFAALETTHSEWRKYGRIAGDSFPNPWEPSYWWEFVASKQDGRRLAAIGGAGVLAALVAAWRARTRAAPVLLAVACACAGAIVATAASAMATFRAGSLARATIERPSGPRLRWLWPNFMYDLSPAHLDVAFAAEIVLFVLVPVIALAGARVARRRAEVVSVGLLATLAVGSVLFTRIRHLEDVMMYPLEGWVDCLQATRWLLIGAAALCIAALSRRAARLGSPRLFAAIALFAAGVAGFVATGPHRATNDNFYPRRDPGFYGLSYEWLPRPETVEPPHVEACAWPYEPWQEAAIRFDGAGAVVFEIDGARRPLLHEETFFALGFDPDDWQRWQDRRVYLGHPPVPRELMLLIDRRVPAGELAAFLRGLPPRVEVVSAAGAFAQIVPSAVGPIETWTLCKLAGIRREAVVAAARDGMTWGDLVDDPGGRFLQRTEPAARGP